MAFTKIQIRRGPSEEWGDVDPILSKGEPGIETDTLRVKFGDGSTPWNDLKYIEAYSPDDLSIAQNSMKANMYQFDDFDNMDVVREKYGKMCDIFFPRLTRGGIPLEHVYMDIFDADYIKMGTFGPSLTDQTIMKTIQEYDNQCSITVRFYIPFVEGQKPHLVFYNDLYGSIIGHRWFKKNRNPAFPINRELTVPARTFITEFYKQVFNVTINNNNIDVAKQTFRKVRNDRAVRVYKPIGGCGDDACLKISGNVEFEDLCNTLENHTTPSYNWELSDEKIGTMGFEGVLYYKDLFRNGSLQKHYVEKHSSRFPKWYLSDSHWTRFHQNTADDTFTTRGPIAIYVFRHYDENANKTIFAFKIGGSCANKIVYQSDSVAQEIGLDSDNPYARMYAEIEFPRTARKVTCWSHTGAEIDFSKAFKDIGRPRPFSVRVEAQELLDHCPNMYNASQTHFKCRFGFYNPENGKYSQPSEWIKISSNDRNCALNAVPLKQ